MRGEEVEVRRRDDEGNSIERRLSQRLLTISGTLFGMLFAPVT